MVEPDRSISFESFSLASSAHPYRNEDSFLVEPERGLTMVLDGMGGMEYGNLASKWGVELLGSGLSEQPLKSIKDIKNTLMRSFIEAGKELSTVLSESGTTATVAEFMRSGLKRHLFVGNMGDSRAYLLRGQTLYLVTEDDSEFNFVVRRRLEKIRGISPEEARDAFEKQFLKEARITKTALENVRTYKMLRRYRKNNITDLVEPAFNSRNIISKNLADIGSLPSIYHRILKAGDLVMLCSDGIHDNLTRRQIKKILLSSPANASESLVKAARAVSEDRVPHHIRSKPDDMTAVVARILS